MQHLMISLLSALALSAASMVHANSSYESNMNDNRYDKSQMMKGGMANKKFSKEKWIQRLNKRLNLSQEQSTSITSIIDKAYPQLMQIKTKMRDNRQQLRDLSVQDTFDEAAVQQLANQQAGYKSELIMLHAKTRHEIAKHLSDAQKEQFKSMRKKRR